MSDVSAKMVVEFLNKHPSFKVKKDSSCEDTDNLLAMRDLLLLVEDAYTAGYCDAEAQYYGDL